MVTTANIFEELIADKRKYAETLLKVQTKQGQVIPFKYNNIQNRMYEESTGMDITVKPSQIGFSTERIANRLIDTLTKPGTNTVLVAYEDFITQRLLAHVNFFYGHLKNLNIPNFPQIHHDSDFQKTFRFYLKGNLVGTSSIYIASARSKTAGRSEPIHHLLLDEHAFYVPEATERIIVPALARIPPGGTVDSFSTPNGEDNEFHEWYVEAKSGRSVFTAHFFPWFEHEEYFIPLGHPHVKDVPETDKPEFKLDTEEETLMFGRGLTFDQLRWRRRMQKIMESLKRRGEIKTLFKQEFPEDDVSCFMATGDMRFDIKCMDRIAESCYPAPYSQKNLLVWYPPEKGRKYFVSIDPGEAKVTQSVITVLTWMQREDGSYYPRYCAREAGMFMAELTWEKAKEAARYYNGAIIGWENNAHGLAITAICKDYKPIYYKKDIVTGKISGEIGWTTSGRTKDYLYDTVDKYLFDLECHDVEFVRQCRNHRIVGDKVEIVGDNDIFMSFAIALCCADPKPIKRGYRGRSGFKWR